MFSKSMEIWLLQKSLKIAEICISKKYSMQIVNFVFRDSASSLVQLRQWIIDFFSCPAANYMDNWKCTGILKGDGSPLTGSSGQPTAMSTVVGSSVHASQNALNGMSAGR